MKNIHVLPTPKPSRVFITKDEGLGFDNQMLSNTELDGQNQNIYISSDEEIKVGDWYYLPRTNSVYKCVEDPIELNLERRLGVAKIILSTDQSLDGVQPIDDEFLEWFVENPTCEYVTTYDGLLGEPRIWKKYIIIPKEEQKQHLIDMMRNDEELGLYEEPKQEMKSSDEDAKIFIDALIKAPEPNEKLKDAFRNYNKQETLEELYLNQLINEISRGFLLDKKTAKEVAIKYSKWQQEQDNKEAKILENILDDNYDLNVQFHKIKRECIYSFATAMYNEKLTFEEWEIKHYGNYVEQPKWQQERRYSEEDMREAFIAGGNSQIEEDDAYGSAYFEYMEKWFEQFKKK
jgi:hypothetical protein